MSLYGRLDASILYKDPNLDKRDEKLLTLLASDSRTAFKALAKSIHLSPDSTAYRLNKLQEKGIVYKCYSQLNFEKLGWKTFHVFFQLDNNLVKESEAFIAQLVKHPNVVSVLEYSDRWDLGVRFLARNIKEFDRISIEIAKDFPELVEEKTPTQLIKLYHHTNYPQKHTYQSRNTDFVNLDEEYKKILRQLSKDARASTYEIADHTDLTADACRKRIHKLQKLGVIERFSILANLSALEYQWYTFFLSVKKFDPIHEAALKEFIHQHPQITRVEKTIGTYDFLFSFVVKNAIEFHNTIKDLKAVFSDIVKNYETMPAFHEHVYNTSPEVIFK